MTNSSVTTPKAALLAYQTTKNIRFHNKELSNSDQADNCSKFGDIKPQQDFNCLKTDLNVKLPIIEKFDFQVSQQASTVQFQPCRGKRNSLNWHALQLTLLFLTLACIIF